MFVAFFLSLGSRQLYSAALPPERQRELSHRYVLGMYSLMERLIKAFPYVLFEGCAGGGGRCGSSFECAGQGANGQGKCGSSYECAGGGGKCGSSYNCSGQGAGGKGKCGSSFECSGGGGKGGYDNRDRGRGGRGGW